MLSPQDRTIAIVRCVITCPVSPLVEQLLKDVTANNAALWNEKLQQSMLFSYFYVVQLFYAHQFLATTSVVRRGLRVHKYICTLVTFLLLIILRHSQTQRFPTVGTALSNVVVGFISGWIGASRTRLKTTWRIHKKIMLTLPLCQWLDLGMLMVSGWPPDHTRPEALDFHVATPPRQSSRQPCEDLHYPFQVVAFTFSGWILIW